MQGTKNQNKAENLKQTEMAVKPFSKPFSQQQQNSTVVIMGQTLHV